MIKSNNYIKGRIIKTILFLNFKLEMNENYLSVSTFGPFGEKNIVVTVQECKNITAVVYITDTLEIAS